MMAKKRHTPEQIINKLRQAEVEIANAATVAQVCKQIGVTDQTYYRWRNEYGGMRVDQAKRLKELEAENSRLKKLVMIPPLKLFGADLVRGREGFCGLLGELFFIGKVPPSG